jgi:hypothetical protein
MNTKIRVASMRACLMGVLVATALVAWLVAPALAQISMNYDLSWSGFTSGGGLRYSGNHDMHDALGQLAGHVAQSAATRIEGGLIAGMVFPTENGTGIHTADQDGDYRIALNELLRIIQFFNSGGFHCAVPPESTEDGFVPGPNPAQQSCYSHDSDYNPAGPSWTIDLTELLRLIQFFNTGGYRDCPANGTEDGYCPGL